MDDPQEYEVESITRARVHDKKGKKITWNYYVKWKGYDWDECTWEPTDSFQGGSEHILESFWERVDTGGRDISDATAFKKGEELVVSGPPVRKGLKGKTKPAKTQASPSKDVSSSNSVTISAPPLTTRKRRRVQSPVDDEWGYLKPRRRIPTADLQNGGPSARSSKRRRASSPGLRKSAPKRQPSVGDSQLDADGETDPDVVEVEDELMQVSTEDAEEDNVRTQHPTTATPSANESKKITFDDLEHFYSGNPIDIDMDEQLVAQNPGTRLRLQSPPPATVLSPDDAAPVSQAPASPPLSSYDPLFDSPPHTSDGAPEIQKDLPLHRARTAKPLVKLIDTTIPETAGKQSRITAKARLMSIHATDVPSTSGPSRDVAKRGGKPGPGRSSAGLITKNRSSLLTATKGTLKSVKGKFTNTTIERDQSDEIDEAPASPGKTGIDKLVVTSWSDEDVADQDHQAMSNSRSAPPPSGDELLKLAGLQADMGTLPDYEDDSATQPQDVKIEGSNLTSAPTEELPNQSSVEVTEGSKAIDHVADASPRPSVSEPEQKNLTSAPTEGLPNQSSVEVTEGSKAIDHVADASPGSSVSEQEQKAPISVTSDPSVPPVVAPQVDEAVKANIELAKEHLFPSTQTSFDSFNTSHSSFQSTIFGPLYQGSTANHAAVAKNESLTTFKVILGEGVELPLVLKDSGGINARIGDILIGNSSGSKVAVFYSAEDALAMASALKGDGTARVVLEPSATTMQREYFSTFLQRFESSHTLVAPVGKEICVLYSSENAGIAQKLGAPAHLRGLSTTILISHACIENQLAYVAAVMQATAL